MHPSTCLPKTELLMCMILSGLEKDECWVRARGYPSIGWNEDAGSLLARANSDDASLMLYRAVHSAYMRRCTMAMSHPKSGDTIIFERVRETALRIVGAVWLKI